MSLGPASTTNSLRLHTETSGHAVVVPLRFDLNDTFLSLRRLRKGGAWVRARCSSSHQAERWLVVEVLHRVDICSSLRTCNFHACSICKSQTFRLDFYSSLTEVRSHQIGFTGGGTKRSNPARRKTNKTL